jgi:hypothetical protein
VPAHVRHGLFARPDVHAVTLRLSNGGTDVQSDRRPDVRGFPLRARKVVYFESRKAREAL